MRNAAAFLLMPLLLAGCIERQNNDLYKRGEVGLSKAIEFGTVVAVRDVTIMADDRSEDASTLLGAGVGAGSGSYVGSDTGNAWATAGGAVAGAVLGNMLATELGKSDGIEYTLQMRNGDIKAIVQDKAQDGELLKVGDKVMLQYCDANEHNYRCKPEKRSDRDFQRLIKVDKFPPEPKKKRRK